MILNNNELVKLKVLVFDTATSEQEDICYKCSYSSRNEECNLNLLCDKYGAFTIRGGVENIVRDLFDTIEDLQNELFIKRLGEIK